ncbi:MAG: class 1 fructose-bisphosphatase [Chloroflexi bacterium]|nr:class 1 fructose-bisphosphatase [Chloroflexota bacterium]
MTQYAPTLTQFILEQEDEYPEATGDFTGLMNAIALAGKLISRETNKAGLADILGLTGNTNVSGDEIQKLDEWSNDTMIRSLSPTGLVCIMASEEATGPIPVPENHSRGKYAVLFDPVDGSSNIDVGAPIGTIFSIHRRVSKSGPGDLEDLMQPGRAQVAAGYIAYGSSTMFVYTTGRGVHGFTLDPSLGEFLLTVRGMRFPEPAGLYSVNEGHSSGWSDADKRWVSYLKTPDRASGRPYSARYIGALVADFHRNLLRGGIFAYPADKSNPEGKLRLLYEAAPLAFVAEQAGGGATEGKQRILDIQPDSLHQRTPLYIGNLGAVQLVEKFHNGEM